MHLKYWQNIFVCLRKDRSTYNFKISQLITSIKRKKNISYLEICEVVPELVGSKLTLVNNNGVGQRADVEPHPRLGDAVSRPLAQYKHLPQKHNLRLTDHSIEG